MCNFSCLYNNWNYAGGHVNERIFRKYNVWNCNRITTHNNNDFAE